MSQSIKPKSFWSKPEGITGAIFLIGGIVGLFFLGTTVLPWLFALAKTTMGIVGILGVLGVLIFFALDGKMRNLLWYMYKSTMRWITGIFIQIDPMGILKSYVDDLRGNLKKMTRQIGKLRGQMHKLKEMIYNNQKDIQTNIQLAKAAKASNEQSQLILKSRKAGRLKDSNLKLTDLYKKMDVLYKVLNKMKMNSAILLEDIEDQIQLKEQEYEAIKASHSAMKSAMNIIKGDKDKKQMFDAALEHIADDVSNKVGEMERFMDMSENFMNSIDLQNGIFEEEGLKMLEKWEKKSTSILLGDDKDNLLLEAENSSDILDLNAPVQERETISSSRSGNQYENFFE